MKIDHPFRPRARVALTSEEEKRLDKLQRDFITKLQSLPEARRNALIRTTAAGMKHEFKSGTGETISFEPDPYTKATARQMRDVMDANGRIEEARAEIAKIDATNLNGHRPNQPNFKGDMLARKDALQEAINVDFVRVIGISEQNLDSAREEAAEHFRARDGEAAKARAILDTADRLRAQATEQDTENRARELVNGERRLAGQKPLPDGQGA